MARTNSKNGGAATPGAKAAAAKAAKVVHTGEAVMPEAVRQLAESAVTRSREAYEQAKDAVEDTVEMLEESLDRAGNGVTEMNQKVIEITQINLNSGFDLAKALASAKDFAQIMELQSGYARKQFETLAAQAEEVRVLAAKVTGETAAPFQSHVSRSMKAFNVGH